MKCYTLCILLCLLLGVVTTVGVAWGFAVCLNSPSDVDQWISAGVNVEDEGSGYSGAVVVIESGFLIQFYVSQPSNVSRSVSERFGEGYSKYGIPKWGVKRIIEEFNKPFPNQNVDAVFIESMGWPVPLMWSGWRRDSGIRTKMELFTGIPTQWKVPNRELIDDDRIVLPVQLIWYGFLLNTLFYTVIWFAFLSCVSAAQRSLRRKRGRCPMCCYDLRGGYEGSCPECGWNRTGVNESA